jgi:hypothetical protein
MVCSCSVLSISADALAVIRRRGAPIHLDLPPLVRGCCGPDLQECPTVRFGAPADRASYVQHAIDGVEVYVPRRMGLEQDYTIAVASFLGFRRIVLEGWCPF